MIKIFFIVYMVLIFKVSVELVIKGIFVLIDMKLCGEGIFSL